MAHTLRETPTRALPDTSACGEGLVSEVKTEIGVLRDAIPHGRKTRGATQLRKVAKYCFAKKHTFAQCVALVLAGDHGIPRETVERFFTRLHDVAFPPTADKVLDLKTAYVVETTSESENNALQAKIAIYGGTTAEIEHSLDATDTEMAGLTKWRAALVAEYRKRIRIAA